MDGANWFLLQRKISDVVFKMNKAELLYTLVPRSP